MKSVIPGATDGAARENRWLSMVSYKNLGTLILFGLPVLALGVMAALAVLGKYGFIVLSVFMTVPMVLAPIIYFLYDRNKLKANVLGDRSFKMLLILYLLLFGFSAILLYAYDVRPILYYLIIAAIATVVLLEIVMFAHDRVRTSIILLQIAALSLNVIWSSSLKYYYFIGRTDIMGHAWMAETVLTSGHVTSAFGVYQAFPLWHIFNAGLYMISGVSFPMYEMMFIICGLVYALTIFAVYVVAKKISGNGTTALATSLFTSFYPFFVLQGTEAMARSITGCLMIVLVFLFMSAKDRRYYFLAILLTLGVIIFHTVSIAFFLAILFLLYAAKKIFRSKEAFPMLDLKYFIIAGAMTAIYWLVAAGNLLVLLQYNIEAAAPTGIITQSVVMTPLNETFNYLQYLPLLLFIILGILVVLCSPKMSQTLRAFSAATLLLIPLTFPGPLMLLNKLNFNLGMDRFYENGYIFMCFAAAIGFVVLYFRSGRPMRALLIGTFAVMVVLCISNDFIATDNPLVKRPFFTHYFTESEVFGMDLTYSLAETPILTDYTTERYLMFTSKPQLSWLVRVDSDDNKFIPPSIHTPIFIRKAELKNRPLDMLCVPGYSGGGYDFYVPIGNLAYINDTSPLWTDLKNYSRIIDTNSIDVYY